MGLAGGQFAEVVVFGGPFQAFDEVVAVEIIADFPVPGRSLITGKNAANGAGTALFNQRFLLLADALLKDIFGIDLRHRVLTGGQLLADLFDLLTDIVFQCLEGLTVIR
ncbi:hypothetical protein D3C78_1494050 [compost metagenome]